MYNNNFSNSNPFINKSFFNPSGEDYSSGIWEGDPNGVLRINKATNKKALHLYQEMRDNSWQPGKFSLIEDKNDFYTLTDSEKEAFCGITSYLSFLDSIQVNNLPFIKIPIKNTEFNLCLAEQMAQEAMHAHSYQYIIDTVVPPEWREKCYKYWQDSELLRNRCKYVADYYEAHNTKPDKYSYACMLLANYLLEGLYFYNGFVFFYTLANRKLMPAIADIIRLINRDEITHIQIFQILIQEAFKEDMMPLSVEEIHSIFDTAVQKEKQWTNSIIGDNVLGITSYSTDNYTKYLANIRLAAIGLPFLYENVENPYGHLEKGSTKSNFFEATVVDYQQSSSVSGWDKF